MRIVYIIVGCVALALGTIGAVVPILPTFPFYLLATICFAKSSKRLDEWFKSTKLYKDNFEEYVNNKCMSKKAKIKVMTSISLLMLVGFIMMGIKGIVPGCIILLGVWIFHVLYFIYGVKTIDISEKSV